MIILILLIIILIICYINYKNNCENYYLSSEDNTNYYLKNNNLKNKNNLNIDPYLLGLNGDIERFIETKKRFNYDINNQMIEIDDPFKSINNPNDLTIKETYDNLVVDYKKLNNEKKDIDLPNYTNDLAINNNNTNLFDTSLPNNISAYDELNNLNYI